MFGCACVLKSIYFIEPNCKVHLFIYTEKKHFNCNSERKTIKLLKSSYFTEAKISILDLKSDTLNFSKQKYNCFKYLLSLLFSVLGYVIGKA